MYPQELRRAFTPLQRLALWAVWSAGPSGLVLELKGAQGNTFAGLEGAGWVRVIRPPIVRLALAATYTIHLSKLGALVLKDTAARDALWGDAAPTAKG